MQKPVTSLMDIISLDFSQAFSETKKVNRFLLVGAQRLSFWPVVRGTMKWTCEKALGFVQSEILSFFRSRRDNVTGPALKAKAIRHFLHDN